jgi:arylsulfatase
VPHIPAEGAPTLGNRSFTVIADIDRPTKTTEGCLFTFGDAKSGVALYILKDRLVFDYNLFSTHIQVRSTIALPTGRFKAAAKLTKVEQTGRVTLLVDGRECGSVDIPKLIRRLWGAGMNIGHDEGLAVSKDYQVPFSFQGTLHELVLEVPPARPTPRDQRIETRADLAQQ